MALAKRMEAPLTGAEVLAILPSFPAEIGRKLRPLLRNADLEVYKHFLATMYHYTHEALPQLHYARDMCTDPVLKEYFDEMAREEDGHHLYAKRDYERLGNDIEAFPRPESVQSFRDYWYGLGKGNVNEFLGAMYVFENVAGAIGKDIIEMITRLELKRSQATWLWLHIEADVNHGADAFKACEQFVNDDPEALLRAAQEGAIEWLRVFEYAFSNKGC